MALRISSVGELQATRLSGNGSGPVAFRPGIAPGLAQGGHMQGDSLPGLIAACMRPLPDCQRTM